MRHLALLLAALFLTGCGTARQAEFDRRAMSQPATAARFEAAPAPSPIAEAVADVIREPVQPQPEAPRQFHY